MYHAAINPTLASLRHDPDSLLTAAEVARLGIRGLKSLERDRWAGEGIPYLKLERRVLYRADDVLAWVESRRVTTSECSEDAIR